MLALSTETTPKCAVIARSIIWLAQILRDLVSAASETLSQKEQQNGSPRHSWPKAARAVGARRFTQPTDSSVRSKWG